MTTTTLTEIDRLKARQERAAEEMARARTKADREVLNG